MKSRAAKRIVGCLLAVAATLLFWSPSSDAENAPNFIVVMADDLGIGDIGPYGNTRIKTPHLDRMAAEGIVFTDFYASANVCTPSRGGLLTGRYPRRLGLTRDVARPTNDTGIEPEEVTLAEALGKAGYATACIGKWHLGDDPDQWPTANGFDYFYGVPYSNDMLPFPLYRMSEVIEEPAVQETLTERYTAEAVQFIEANKDDPFFLYLPHTMPHVPLFASESFTGTSDASLYGDVVETIDWSMGQIFEALARIGIDDNTLVIFTSDNGPWWEGSAARFRSRKGNAWEGGMRVPMIARWPGTIPAGATTNAIAMNIDYFPTLLSAAGVKPPKGVTIDGKDIAPVLRGGDQSPHDFLLLYDGPRVAAVRSQAWKLVMQSWYRNWNARIGSENYHHYPGLLFDMTGDALEEYSVTREHPDVANQLRAWADEAGERIR